MSPGLNALSSAISFSIPCSLFSACTRAPLPCTATSKLALLTSIPMNSLITPPCPSLHHAGFNPSNRPGSFEETSAATHAPRRCATPGRNRSAAFGALTRSAQPVAYFCIRLRHTRTRREHSRFNANSAKTTPREVMAAPERSTISFTGANNRPVTVPDVAISYLAMSSRSLRDLAQVLFFLGVHRGPGGEAFRFLRGHGGLNGEALNEVHNSL